MKIFPTTLMTVFAIGVIVSSRVQAKRIAAAEIPPITNGGVTYLNEYKESGGGFEVSVIAQKAADKTVLWKTPIYKGAYDRNLEQDVQDIRLVSVQLKEKTLVILDERGKTYKVDAATGKLLSPTGEVSYPKGL